MARLQAGDLPGAREDVETALADPMLSPSLGQRLGQLRELLGEGEG